MKRPFDPTRAASIRRRIALAVVFTVAVYLGVDQVLRTIQFKASFDALDARTARLAVADAREAIERRAERLGAAADLVAAGLPVGPETCDPIGADLVFVVSPDGHVDESHVSAAVPDGRARLLFPNERWAPAHPILDSHGIDASSGGLVGLTFTGDVALYAARTYASEDGPRIAVVADLVDDDALSELASRAGRTAHVHASGGVFAAGTGALDRTAEVITAEGSLLDSRGRSLGTITVEVPNEVADFRADVERFQVLTAVGAALLFPLALLVLLQIVVTGPLQRLTRAVVDIGDTNDVGGRSLATERADEIGTLANAFDDMLRKLDASRRASLRVARLSGRADVAIDVAHNAGNAVNSVAVAAQLARQRATALSTADLDAIVEALKGARHDLQRYVDEDPRGKHLLPFLESTVSHLADQFRALDEDCSHLEQHTEKVVGMLGRLTDVAPGRERGEDEVIDVGQAARSVLVDAIGRARADVRVDAPEDAQEAIVACDPERLRDMLEALAQNAIEAVADAPDPVIRVRATTEGDEVQLLMEDNGHGIPGELAESIFEQGVTTRGGRPGLGLHLAAVTAHEMRGSLAVTSDGPGRGAAAVLRMPAADDRRRHVAPTPDSEAAASEG